MSGDGEQTHTLASWLPDFGAEYTCPDMGLRSYLALDDRTGPRVIIWFGVMWAIEQTLHAIVLFTSHRLKITAFPRFFPRYTLPTGLVLAWVVFTGLSLVLVPLTFRSSAAILAKTLHVTTETLFLVTLAVAFELHLFAAACLMLVVVVLMLVLTLPCKMIVIAASVSGIVLDSVNFLAHALYGIRHPNDAILWTLIGGFGWHALYLLSYLGIMRWRMANVGRVTLRIFGMYANNIANEFFLSAARQRLYGRLPTGIVTVREWAAASDRILCVWTPTTLVVLNAPEGADVTTNGYAPYTTAYVGASLVRLVNAVFPWRGRLALRRRGHEVDVRETVLCTTCVRAEATSVVADGQRAIVFGWMSLRVAYWGLALLVGAVAASYP